MDLPFDRPVIHDLDFFAGEGFPDPLDVGPAVGPLLLAPGGEVDLMDYASDEEEVGAPVFFLPGRFPAPSDEEDEEEQDEDWDEEEDSGYESLSEEEQEEEDEDRIRRIYEEVFGSSLDLSELAPPPTPPPAPSPAPASPGLGGSKRTREDDDDAEDPSSKRPRWSYHEDSPDEPSTSAGTSGGFLRYFHLGLRLDPEDSDDDG